MDLAQLAAVAAGRNNGTIYEYGSSSRMLCEYADYCECYIITRTLVIVNAMREPTLVIANAT